MDLSPANTSLRQALIAEAEKLGGTNAISRAHLLGLIEEYVGARDALAALSAETVSSYSVGGRSFTRRNLADLEGRVNALVRDLVEALPSAAVLLPATDARFCGVLF